MFESFQLWLQAWLPGNLGQLGPGFEKLPREIVLYAWALPLVLALFARRITPLVAVVFLMALAFVALADSSRLGTLLALTAYGAAIVLAMASIGAQRRQRKLQTEVGELRREVERLQASEERRLLRDLKTSAGPVEGTNPQ